MNTIKLPRYIIFSDGTRILTTNYKQHLENEDLLLISEDGHTITITRTSNGNVGIVSYNTPVQPMGKHLEISKETEEELKNLNIKV